MWSGTLPRAWHRERAGGLQLIPSLRFNARVWYQSMGGSTISQLGHILAHRSPCPLLFQVLDELLDRRSSGCVSQATLLKSPGCRRDWRCITCFAANRVPGSVYGLG